MMENKADYTYMEAGRGGRELKEEEEEGEEEIEKD